MPNFLAFGRTTQLTSAAMITTPADVFTNSGVRQSTPTSASIINTNPTFAGITGLVPQLNGSLLASWAAATSVNVPLVYDVYMQLGTATGLFVDANKVESVFSTSVPLFTLVDGTLLVKDSIYHVGVVARDPLGNSSPLAVSLSAVSEGVNPNRVMTPDDIPAIWAALRALNQVAGSFGEALQGIITPTRASNLDGLTPARSANLDNLTGNITPSRANNLDNLTGNITPTRANNLDNLDATISSRATQASVDAIQNNTSFVGIVPAVLLLPETGTKTYRLYASLFDEIGMPENPDSNLMSITIEDSAGSPVVAITPMTQETTGRWYYDYVVNSTDTERNLRVVFDYIELAVPFRHYRVTEVQEFESKLDVLISRLTVSRANNLDNLTGNLTPSRANNLDNLTGNITPARAANLDNITGVISPARAANLDFLDVSVLSRQSASDALTQFTSLTTDISTRQSAVDSAAQTADIQADIATRQSSADSLTQYNDLNSDIAVVDDKVDGLIVDVASVKSDTTLIGTPLTTTVIADVDRLYNRVGPPAGSSIAADIAAIKGDTSFVSSIGSILEIEGIIEDDEDSL